MIDELTQEFINELIKRNHYFLPDSFFRIEDAVDSWKAILSPKFSLSDYVRHVPLKALSAKTRKQLKPASGIVLSMLYATQESRYEAYSELPETEIGKALIIESRLPFILKKLPEAKEKFISLASEAILDVAQHSYLEFVDYFPLYTEEEYAQLSKEQRIIYQFCANTMLCGSRNDLFIHTFLEEYPWIRKEQEIFYRSISRKIESADFYDSLDSKNEATFVAYTALSNEIKGSFKHGRIDFLSANRLRFILQTAIKDPSFNPDMVFWENLLGYSCHLHDKGGEVIRKIMPILKDQEDAIKSLLGNMGRLIVDIDYINFTNDSYILVDKFINESKHTLFEPTKETLQFLSKLYERDDIVEELQQLFSGSFIGSTEVSELSESLVRLDAELKPHCESFFCDFKIEVESTLGLIEGLLEIDSSLSDTHAQQTAAQDTREESRKRIEAYAADITRLKEQIKVMEEAKKGHIEEEERLSQKVAELENVLTFREQELSEAKKELFEIKSGSNFEFHAPSSIEQGADTKLAELIRKSLKGEARLMPEEILSLYNKIAPDRFEILPSAFKSAREASNFELPGRLIQMMESLGYGYLDAIRNGTPDSEARELLGNRYAAVESDSVTNTPKFRALREFTYKGEKIFFRQHVGIGSGYGTQYAIRIHFKVIDNKMVIAHCGEHLEGVLTN